MSQENLYLRIFIDILLILWMSTTLLNLPSANLSQEVNIFSVMVLSLAILVKLGHLIKKLKNL